MRIDNPTIEELVAVDVAHVTNLLDDDPTYDQLADATEALARAANRVAPDGHGVYVQRDRNRYDSIHNLETERMSVTRGAS